MEFPHKLEFSTLLECTPERAFSVLADAATWPLWFDGCKSVVWNTPPPHKVGSVRTVTLQLATAVEEITAYDRGERFAFTVKKLTPPLIKHMQEELSLTAADGATRVGWVVSYEPSFLGSAVHPIARMIFSRMFRRSVAGLKRYTRPAAE